MNKTGSVMCLDTSKVERSASVQKKLRLGEILAKETEYFSGDILTEKMKEGWRPLKFATTIRSLYSNKILCFDIEDEKRTVYYHTYGSVDRFIHIGYDLVMFLSSLSVMSCLSDAADKGAFNNLMFNHSKFQVMGLFYNAEIVDPVVYSIIYIEDEPFDEFFTPLSLADGWRVEDIKKMKEDSHGNLRALIDEIIVLEKKGDE